MQFSYTARLFTLTLIVSLLLSALPAAFFVAIAASTGIGGAPGSQVVGVDQKAFFTASAVFDTETTPGTYVSVSDDSAGGSFYSGTLADSSCSDTVDADSQFAISQNKGICYSNSATGTFEITLQLLDGSEGSPIGDPATVDIMVVELPEAVSICHFDGEETGYSSVEVSTSDLEDDHFTVDTNDIIPPFYYLDEVIKLYAGQNWGDDGQALYEQNCVLESSEEGSSTIVAEKLVCTDPADMPGDNLIGMIDADTASDWAEEYDSCTLEPDFSFQYAPQGTANPGDDLVGEAGEPWVTFGPTDENGYAEVTIDAEFFAEDEYIWMREVQQEGFQTFERGAPDADEDDVSSKFFCHTDTLNADNYDRIDGIEAGETYYCVAWNLTNEPAGPACTVTIVSDEMDTVVEKDGAFAQLLSFVHPAWTAVIDGASWIWGDDPVQPPVVDVTQTFVKEFTFQGPVEGAVLYVAADNTYTVTLNGTEVAAVTDVDNFRSTTQDEYDVASLILEDAVNTLEIEVTNTEGSTNAAGNPAGLLYKLVVTGEDEDCDQPLPEEASLEITDPATEGETLSGEYTFQAEYIDDDETEDAILWAIRAGTCAASTNTMAGNVDGFSDPSDFTAPIFSATVDMSSWEDGEYCFVVNPQENDGGEDFRATRTFILDNPEPLVCAPGVNLLENPDFELPPVVADRGWDLVDPIGWLVELVAGGDAQMELQAGVNGWLPSTGEQHSELAGNQASIFSQPVPTIAGESYTLSWDYSPRPGQTSLQNEMDVFVDGVEVANNDGTTDGNQTEWTTYTYEFIGTGDDVVIAFADAGPSNGVGPLLDNTSLVCNPAPEAGPYCGDGQVNQEWEQCEIGDEDCTEYCLYENQCSYEQLVKITLDETESVSFDGMLYLGDAANPIPNGTWFSFNEAGDASFNSVANEVDGLAIERNQEDGELKVGFIGGNAARKLDNVAGTIETLGVTLGTIDRSPNPSFPLEDGGRGIDVVEKNGSNELSFDMLADTGNDGFAVGINSRGIPFNCPVCLATVEARIVLRDVDGNLGNAGTGNLAEEVVLGDGSTVAFGEWFNVFDGTEYITDPSMAESIANGEDGGLFVSRTGDGTVKVALYGFHTPGGNENHEFIKASLEFRDAEIDAASLAGLAGDFQLEDHPENDVIDSNDGFDEIVTAGSDRVDFDLWADTKADGFKVKMDATTIDSCENDDSTYVIEGHKWSDENGNGVWDDSEDTIPGWTIYIEGDDFFEIVVTDETGYYSLEVPAGDYVVYEEDRDGWLQTFPEPYMDDDEAWLPDAPLWPEFLGDDYTFGACQYHFGSRTKLFSFYDETAPTWENPEVCNFGNQQLEYTIFGYKWNDLNNNGEWDDNEPGLEDWTIFADNGEEELETTTDEDGYYEFEVGSGEWVVSEEQQSGWTQTAPFYNEDGTCEFSLGQLSQGYEFAEGEHECSFGNYLEPEVEGSSISCSLTANREEVSVGNQYFLSWSTSGATTVTIDNEIGTVDASGSIELFAPEEEGELTFTLVATDGEEEIVCTETVFIDEPSGGSNRRSSGPSGTVAGASISVPEPEVAGAACGLYLYEYMRLGQDNSFAEVIKLQVFLNMEGFPVAVTGTFDEATEAAVRAFQLAYADEVLIPWFNLDPSYGTDSTGWVYKTTRWKINDIKCPDIEPFPELP